MEKKDKTMKELEKLMPLLRGDEHYVQTVDFIEVFKAIAEVIKTLRAENQSSVSSSLLKIEKYVNLLLDAHKDVKDEVSDSKKSSDNLLKKFTGAVAEIKKSFSEFKAEMQRQIDMVEDGEDGEDADEDAIYERLVKKFEKNKKNTLDANSVVSAINSSEIKIDWERIDAPDLTPTGRRGGFGSMMKEAPRDGQVYARQNREWVVVTTSVSWGDIEGTLADQTDLQSALDAKQNSLGYTAENVANKATNFGTVNDTLYPTVQAVKTYADSLVTGLLDYRGAYDASVNTFPASGGSGSAGAILKGDTWVISVAGTLGSVAIQVGDSIIANVDTPGQTTGNWNKLNTNISYVPEDSANKVTSVSGASTDTQYPSAKLLYDSVSVLPTASSTTTFTNKRITKRVSSTTDDATAVIDSDACDEYVLTAVANATEFSMTGTPTDGQTVLLRFKDAGVAKALTWTGITALGVTLPTTTVAGKWHLIGLKYFSSGTTWYAVGVSVQA